MTLRAQKSPKVGKVLAGKETRVATQVLTVASITSTITYAQTNAQVALTLEYFILGWAEPMPEGLTVAAQNQWKLDQANAKIRDYVRAEARRNRLQQLRDAQANLGEQADSETAL